MPDTNEVASQPAPTAAQAATETTSDGKTKSGISMAQAAQMLIKAAEARNQPAAQPVVEQRSSHAAAAPAESSAASEGTATPLAQPDAPPEASKLPAETPGDTPEVLSNFSHLDPKTREIVEGALKSYKESSQENINKRIGKVIAEKKAAEEALIALRAQVSQQPSQQPTASQPPPLPSEVPLNHIQDVAGLQKEQTQAAELKRLSQRYIDLGPNPEGKYLIDGKEFTKEQLVNIRDGAALTLEEYIPKRYQHLQQRDLAIRTANEKFPWLKDQASSEAQFSQTVVAQNPWIKNLPNSELWIGYCIEGMKAVEARERAAKAAPSTNGRRPASDLSAPAASVNGSTRAAGNALQRQEVANEREKLKEKKGISARDAAKYLERSSTLNSR